MSLVGKCRPPIPKLPLRQASRFPFVSTRCSASPWTRTARFAWGEVGLEDAKSDQTWASKHWMPDLSVGIGTWRHDGGIQDFYGNLIKSDYSSALAGLEIAGRYDWKEILLRRVEAEHRVWRQRADVSKLSSENLLEAATTYIDLLGSHTGIVFWLETEIRLRDLLEQARTWPRSMKACTSK